MVEETKKLSCKIKINRINVYFCSAKNEFPPKILPGESFAKLKVTVY